MRKGLSSTLAILVTSIVLIFVAVILISYIQYTPSQKMKILYSKESKMKDCLQFCRKMQKCRDRGKTIEEPSLVFISQKCSGYSACKLTEKEKERLKDVSDNLKQSDSFPIPGDCVK